MYSLFLLIDHLFIDVFASDGDSSTTAKEIKGNVCINKLQS